MSQFKIFYNSDIEIFYEQAPSWLRQWNLSGNQKWVLLSHFLSLIIFSAIRKNGVTQSSNKTWVTLHSTERKKYTFKKVSEPASSIRKVVSESELVQLKNEQFMLSRWKYSICECGSNPTPPHPHPSLPPSFAFINLFCLTDRKRGKRRKYKN